MQDVLHNINADVFNEIDSWVHKSFSTICSSGKPDINKAACSYPIVTDVLAKQIFTALVVMSEFLLYPNLNRLNMWIYKQNMQVIARVVTNKERVTLILTYIVTCWFADNLEFVDDLQTFADLGTHLHSRGCHVANLSSVDFSAKSGIGGCLRSLSRQILKDSIDVSFVILLSRRDFSVGEGS